MIMSVDKIGERIERQHEKEPFSGVVTVRTRGKTVFEKGFGYANRAEQIPNTINTRFGVASGSKMFTAVAICQLVEQGKLAFETRLKDCLNVEFPLFDSAVTVHHLLTHSAGIPDYFDEETSDAHGDYGALWTEHPMYTMRTGRDFLPMFQHEPMKFTPGERFSYSNAGFVVLGMIVEQQSGQPFTDYIQEHIFARAEMTECGYFALDQLTARTAYGYIEAGSGTWRTNMYSIPIVGCGDGGAFVTAPDMGRFWDALLGHRLLSPAMTQTMLQPRVFTDDPPGIGYYGYGIWLIKAGETVTEYYGVGADPGVAFVSRYDIEHDLQVTILGNTENAAWPMSRAIRAAMAE
jgi:CubicO group peptidase (beta-lactamase class C family)